ncbi:MAG: glycine--tRNA ligase subunit beta [Thiohalospira sp.]
MSDRADLLVEIGTEELPPRALQQLANALRDGLLRGLDEARLEPGEAEVFAAPRRLAVRIRGVRRAQDDQSQERRGPAVDAAFDADGNPTRAATGFAGSCGVEVADLDRLETDKGTWLVYRYTEPGRPAADLIPAALERAVEGLPIPRRMRWGDSEAAFVRPVHWLVILLGDAVVPAELLETAAGNTSGGHRFHHPGPVTIPDAASYPGPLENEGWVVADFDDRRARIRGQVEEQARAAGGRAWIEEDLLDEVTAMVEWPVALTGSFDRRFLAIPHEALMASMQGHQKYFPVVDDDGALLPAFVTVANIASHRPEEVRAGNERVIRPRLEDTEFFWDHDRRIPLADRLPHLGGIVFEHRLGTQLERTRRLQPLAAHIAGAIGGEPASAERAAELAKCDLLTEMVGEFPELQGTMGRYYAAHDGEGDDIPAALEEQYRPRFAGDELPTTATGRALALADRLDVITGLFGIGQPPTGSKDPFGLRRAALGVLRICIEGRLDLDLGELIDRAAASYREQLGADGIDPATEGEAIAFILERLRVYYQERGVTHDAYEAVRSVAPPVPLDFDARVRAMAAFLQREEADALVGANKRIANILRKAGVEAEQLALPDPALFTEGAERTLFDALTQRREEVAGRAERRDYDGALDALAGLREAVDGFFDQVMVMAEDEAVRNNRLALLADVRRLFLQVADPSRVQE